jgi:hypothetical protein
MRISDTEKQRINSAFSHFLEVIKNICNDGRFTPDELMRVALSDMLDVNPVLAVLIAKNLDKAIASDDRCKHLLKYTIEELEDLRRRFE